MIDDSVSTLDDDAIQQSTVSYLLYIVLQEQHYYKNNTTARTSTMTDPAVHSTTTDLANAPPTIPTIHEPSDLDELFLRVKSKKPWALEKKRELLKSFVSKSPRHLFDLQFSKRVEVAELFTMLKTAKKSGIATWNATRVARKLVFIYRMVEGFQRETSTSSGRLNNTSRLEDEDVRTLRK